MVNKKFCIIDLSVTMTTFDSHYFFAAEEEGLLNFYNVFQILNFYVF